MINAMDAMANTSVAARKVTLQLSRVKSGKVEIAVIDGGHGIETGVRNRLFDSFFTTKPKGLGLGLSIARTIPKRMLAVSAPKTIHRAGQSSESDCRRLRRSPLLRRPPPKHRKQARHDRPGPDRSFD